MTWAIVVALVALAEEAFLRGSLFEAIKAWHGSTWAIVITALAFTGLHIPIYGWSVVPLDFVVGLLLGQIRVVSKTWLAPGLAHTLADLAGWWLR